MNQEIILFDRVKTIFLGLTIGAIKQITASHETFSTKYNSVKKIIQDDYMQNILADYNFSGESAFKRLLFWSMKCQFYTLSYFIFKVKSFIDNLVKKVIIRRCSAWTTGDLDYVIVGEFSTESCRAIFCSALIMRR